MSEETFTADWLALREPVDHRSRAADLVAPLAEWWGSRPVQRVLDLGSGTGSNLRYLAPRLAGEQEWTLVDRDAALLERATGEAVAVPGVARVERVTGELDREGLELVPAADLVTASSLLDLVTHEWLERLVATCRAAGNAALLTLTWDGAMTWDDADPDDALVAEAVRSHQRRDKGMGPALGPAAGPAAERAFRAAGYHTRLRPSPWRLGADDASLARALIDGWGVAASEERSEDGPLIRGWAERRRTAVTTRFGLEVGHVDLLALPPDTRSGRPRRGGGADVPERRGPAEGSNEPIPEGVHAWRAFAGRGNGAMAKSPLEERAHESGITTDDVHRHGAAGVLPGDQGRGLVIPEHDEKRPSVHVALSVRRDRVKRVIQGEREVFPDPVDVPPQFFRPLSGVLEGREDGSVPDGVPVLQHRQNRRPGRVAADQPELHEERSAFRLHSDGAFQKRPGELVGHGDPVQGWTRVVNVPVGVDLVVSEPTPLRPGEGNRRHQGDSLISGSPEVVDQRLTVARQEEVVLQLVVQPETAEKRPV